MENKITETYYIYRNFVGMLRNMFINWTNISKFMLRGGIIGGGGNSLKFDVWHVFPKIPCEIPQPTLGREITTTNKKTEKIIKKI